MTTSRCSARVSRVRSRSTTPTSPAASPQELGFERSDAAEAAVRLARSYASAEEAFRASRSGRDLIDHGPELEADIARCARESVLDVVPRLVAHARRRRRAQAVVSRS